MAVGWAGVGWAAANALNLGEKWERKKLHLLTVIKFEIHLQEVQNCLINAGEKNYFHNYCIHEPNPTYFDFFGCNFWS